MIKLVACDMAGTTIDEHGDVYVALARCVEETGVTTTPEAVQEWMGADKVEAITALIQAGGGTADPATISAAFVRFKELLVELYDANPPVALEGVEEAFRDLRSKGVKVALTTGFSRDVAEPLLERLGWSVHDDNLLDAVVCSDEVAAGRPAPHMIHRAMELTGVQDVRAVIAAGDTVNDLAAANNAGVTAVGVLTGKLDREALAAHPHHHILDGVKDIPALLS
ncbi:phosphonatase-like hydrolase [Pseudarthrobacter sp. PvP004]|jgi:phosphonatase-like hydrolase|uniref:Phosphonoacetaldehyde hydrolase n=1 Tax=Paenarthrobacter aurescens (strain TC1) TaxID=290340 RepID=A1R432_PAEAT|nr:MULTISPECIES: phosphonatase-like hydrolase [Micrococcaceae]ABM06511.1 putative phosphonoacetaldehyde hydrolase [Paenarthrobacter aurescens TC1]MBP2266992.1 phosphonatase-like hydrolase [Pseudarthrobacter sp. PvP004]